jgi:hypothetical protein
MSQAHVYIEKELGDLLLLLLANNEIKQQRNKLNREGPTRERERERDVGEVAAAGRAKTADERSSGSIKEAWYAFRDCLLQEQGPLLALWRVSALFFFYYYYHYYFKSIIICSIMFIFRTKKMGHILIFLF